jgi:hypothetical protein
MSESILPLAEPSGDRGFHARLRLRSAAPPIKKRLSVFSCFPAPLLSAATEETNQAKIDRQVKSFITHSDEKPVGR